MTHVCCFRGPELAIATLFLVCFDPRDMQVRAVEATFSGEHAGEKVSMFSGSKAHFPAPRDYDSKADNMTQAGQPQYLYHNCLIGQKGKGIMGIELKVVE